MQDSNSKEKRHPRCRFSIGEELQFVDRYENGETFSDMAGEYDVHRKTLWKIVTRIYQIEPYQTSAYPKQYDLNVKTFEEINEKSAYALGLIATDGHITSLGDLRFWSSDKEQTENLLKCLECTKEPKIIPAGKYSNKKTGYFLNLGHKKLIGDVLNYIPKKSENLACIPPAIEESNCLHHYIRGILDGDGSVNKLGHIVFTGNKRHMEDLQRCILDNYQIQASSIIKVSGSKNSYHLYYSRNRVWEDLYHILYDDANYYLTRKKEMFQRKLGDN